MWHYCQCPLKGFNFKGIKSTALYFLFGDRYVGDGDTDRREIVHDGTYRPRTGSLPFWGRYNLQGIHKIPNVWSFNCESLENCKSQRYMSIRT